MNLPPASEPDGVLLVDKPQGITSHDVVDRVRRLYSTRRVGHAGTLDPMATGLLIILVGKACKASQYLMSQEKEYVATVKFGENTDSQDADGEVVETIPLPDGLDAEKIRAAMKGMLGDQYQTPPMYSAKKIAGVPLYKLARKGEEVEREPRFIRVERYDLLSWREPEADFIVKCSKGTYVRTLAYDLAKKLGTAGHLTALRRTFSGTASVADAATLEALGAMDRAARLARLVPAHKYVPSGVPV